MMLIKQKKNFCLKSIKKKIINIKNVNIFSNFEELKNFTDSIENNNNKSLFSLASY